MKSPTDGAAGAERELLPDAFMQMVRSFQESRIVLTAIELDVFTAVGTGRSAAEIAQTVSSDVRGVEILLHALAALELLEKRDDRFFNGPLATRFLCADSPHDWRPALKHSVSLWNRWSMLTECVRTGQPAPRRESGPAETEAFIAAMHHNTVARAGELIRVLDLGRVRRMLDVGGGSGGYSIAFAHAVPGLRAEICDLEDVVPIAERNVATEGLSDRVTTRICDISHEPLGAGYDLVLVSAICHMFDAATNADLVRRCAEALAPGGRLVVQDFILDADRVTPRGAALFSVNMLVSTARGRDYTEAEYRQWMQSAGLGEVQRITLQSPTQLVVGVKR